MGLNELNPRLSVALSVKVSPEGITRTKSVTDSQSIKPLVRKQPPGL